MSNIFRPSDDMSNNINMPISASSLDALYASLDPRHVEQFYEAYTSWSMRQQLAVLQAQLTQLDQQVNDNAVLMQLVQPSALSLAALSRLQSYGVEDIDLLDTMLERGDEWLDHAMQLLSQCERLELIHDNYTEWCRHALEGAYEWIDTMNGANFLNASNPGTSSSVSATAVSPTRETSSEETAELLLRKLMSDDETIKTPAITSATQAEQASILEEPASEQASLAQNQVVTRAIETDVPVSNEHQSAQELAITDDVLAQPVIADKDKQDLDSPNDQTTALEENNLNTQVMQNEQAQKLPGRTLVARVLASFWKVA